MRSAAPCTSVLPCTSALYKSKAIRFFADFPTRWQHPVALLQEAAQQGIKPADTEEQPESDANTDALLTKEQSSFLRPAMRGALSA